MVILNYPWPEKIRNLVVLTCFELRTCGLLDIPNAHKGFFGSKPKKTMVTSGRFVCGLDLKTVNRSIITGIPAA